MKRRPDEYQKNSTFLTLIYYYGGTNKCITFIKVPNSKLKIDQVPQLYVFKIRNMSV